jgi:hypothetical protein
VSFPTIRCNDGHLERFAKDCLFGVSNLGSSNSVPSSSSHKTASSVLLESIACSGTMVPSREVSKPTTLLSGTCNSLGSLECQGDSVHITSRVGSITSATTVGSLTSQVTGSKISPTQIVTTGTSKVSSTSSLIGSVNSITERITTDIGKGSLSIQVASDVSSLVESIRPLPTNIANAVSSIIASILPQSAIINIGGAIPSSIVQSIISNVNAIASSLLLAPGAITSGGAVPAGGSVISAVKVTAVENQVNSIVSNALTVGAGTLQAGGNVVASATGVASGILNAGSNIIASGILQAGMNVIEAAGGAVNSGTRNPSSPTIGGAGNIVGGLFGRSEARMNVLPRMLSISKPQPELELTTTVYVTAKITSYVTVMISSGSLAASKFETIAKQQEIIL